MAETDGDNALLARGGGGLPGPVLVDPLNALTRGNQAAQAEFTTRGMQAQQAWGQILQQSTDENGNVDYSKAQRLAAQAGPVVQMKMMEALKDTSQLKTQQLNNTAGSLKLMGTSAVTLARDPSDGNVNTVFDNMIANGHPRELAERERARFLAMSPIQRQQQAERYAMQVLDQFHQVVGQTTTRDTGAGFVAETLVPQGATTPAQIKTGQGEIPKGVSPETVLALPPEVWTVTTQDQEDARRDGKPIPAIGSKIAISGEEYRRRMGYTPLQPGRPGQPANVVNQDGTPASQNPPRVVRKLNVPPPAGGAAGPDVPIVPAGAQSPPAPVPVPPAPVPVPPAPVPVPPQPPPPTPPRPGTGSSRDSMTPGPGAMLQGGVQVASANPLLTPQTGAPSAPSALVPGDVGAVMAGMDRARAARGAGGPPGTQTAWNGPYVVTGPGNEEQVTAKVSNERREADSKLSMAYAANVFPYAQALAGYGRGMTTAPGSDFFNAAKGFAGGVLRSMGVNTPLSDDVKSYDAQHKWLSQIIVGNPVAQGSDARLAQTLAGNANTGIHELAGEDMMKAGIALMRMTATADSEWSNMKPDQRAKYGGYYSNFQKEFNKTVDPRAFGWDMYNPEQRKTIAEDLRAHYNDPAYAKKLSDSLAMVRRNGYISETRAMP